MTSFAFIAGLLPLVFCNWPGAIGNRTIGSASAGGMLIGTVFGLFVIQVCTTFLQPLQRNTNL
jgi:HAE1 family hydrophobic/amphiphilic exporter-1